MAMSPQESAALGAAIRHVKALQEMFAQLQQGIALMQSRPRSITEEIDAIPGRRMEGVLSGEIQFTIAQNGRKGDPVTFNVSQDGQFIQTHYPMVVWYPNAPDNTPNFNKWRPVTLFPLPDQVVDTDYINLKYEMFDGGTQRALQNGPRGPIFSRPDNMVPLPVPTLYAPATIIQFIPTYLSITFDGAENPPTSGILHVDLPGYRIINL